MAVANVSARNLVLPLAILIEKGDVDGANQAILDIKEKLQDERGDLLEPGPGYIRPAALAQLAKGENRGLLFERLRGTFGSDAMAEAVTRCLLCFPGVDSVFEALGKVNQAAGKTDLPTEFGFKIKDTSYGPRVEFDPRGKSLGEIARAVNAECQKLYGRPAILDDNISGMKYKPSGPVVVYPMLEKSHSMTSGGITEYLENEKLWFANPAAVADAAALYRLPRGFPVFGNEVGTSDDQGDLFHGDTVVTGQSSRSHEGGIAAMKTFAQGVARVSGGSGFDTFSHDRGDWHILTVAASPITEK